MEEEENEFTNIKVINAMGIFLLFDLVKEAMQEYLKDSRLKTLEKVKTLLKYINKFFEEKPELIFEIEDSELLDLKNLLAIITEFSQWIFDISTPVDDIGHTWELPEHFRPKIRK